MQTQAELTTLNSQGEEADHLACPCSKDIAVCGVRVDPVAFRDEEWDEGEMCILCEIGAEMPCPRCGE